MTHAPMITATGPCADACPGSPGSPAEAGQCGERMRVDGADGTHMGFALALLHARWSSDTSAADFVTSTIEHDELLRSAIELSLSLAMSASAGLSGAEDPDMARHIDRETAGLWLTSMGSTFSVQGHAVAAILCADLARILATPGRVRSLDLHAVDLDSVLAVAAALVRLTEDHRGVSAARQFASYTQIMGMALRAA